jgi:hypothetical protein
VQSPDQSPAIRDRSTQQRPYTTFGGVKIVIATDDLASARAALP